MSVKTSVTVPVGNLLIAGKCLASRVGRRGLTVRAYPVPVERAEDDQPDELAESSAERAADDLGGEAACFAPLLCPECGVVLDGSPHADGCPAGE
jgi:hypothetical protein